MERALPLPAPMSKSFLFLFFKKEILSFCSFLKKRTKKLLTFWLCFQLALASMCLLYAGQVFQRAHLAAPAPTPIIYDRNGVMLAQFGDRQDQRTEYGYWPVDPVPDRVARATLALEDRRFAGHPGVDMRAVLRAAWQHLQGGRSGASTIAMQVARMQHPAPRTLWAKAVEAGTALALTARYGRNAVLAQYLRLVPYGNGSHGIGHAARWYFDKPVADLSWAEIAMLSAIPHAPATLNPLHPAGLERCRHRALRILDVLAAQGAIRAGELAAARGQLDALQVATPPTRPVVALHAILRLQRMLAVQGVRDAADPRIRTSLDLGLQTELAALAEARLHTWRGEGAQQVAVMVTRRHSRQVLAALGSAGFNSLPAGRMDYTSARRSPGSALKPFVYALALERGMLSPAQVMQDLPDASAGIGNADGGFLGAILPRQALANSRNVPAVTLLRQVGLPRAFDELRSLGLHDLDGSPDRFGLSMAIGSLPTSLDRLMRAYATLAEDGLDGDLAWYQGQSLAPPRQLVQLAVARQITQFLSDPMARLPSFQRYGSVEYPFAVALKTGTSQGYRDAWVVAWSQAFEVGVWVGRADAGPMTRLSGALSAADLAQAVLLRLHGVTRGDLQADAFAPPPGRVPAELCTTTGLRAGAGCASRITEFVSRYELPVPAAADGSVHLSIVSPAPETRFWRNPEVPAAMNRLALRASVEPPVGQIVWRVDGQDYAIAAPAAPLYWPATPGVHRFQIRLPLQNGASRVVRVVVE
jgi:penicillin-binding protein 1C